jgi:pyruvate,water dikinase
MRSSASLAVWQRVIRRRDGAGVPAGTLTLGSGSMASAGVGSKAALLDDARRFGLAVPAGFVVPEGAAPGTIDHFLATTGATTVAVRSAFSVEDGTRDSHAGWFLTRLRVHADDYPQAVTEVRASADEGAMASRRDVLVMCMVDARHAGVAFSEPGTYDDLVNVVAGTAEHLVSGGVEGQRRELPRLERVEAGWPRRLQKLLRRVRRHFGDRPWDIEWADDGHRCWLLQIRPITRALRRDEALTIANHAEILPPLPSTLMTSVIAQAGPDLFAWYRRADPTLPSGRAFLEVVAGRPFINLSLLEDMLRHWGLPTRLVADSIGGPPQRVVGWKPGRVLRRAPALARLGWAQVTAVSTAARLRQRVAARGETPVSFSEQAERLREAYVDLVTGMFPLSSAMGPPLAILRRAGTLVDHASHHRTVTTDMAAALDAARHGGPNSDPWQFFLHRFGHRGVYESDIALPRYRDDPSWLAGAASGVSARRASSTRPWRVLATTPVWWLARAPLAAREALRDAAMVGFAQLRDGFVALARLAVDDGRLPSVDHLWLLTVEELGHLDQGWCPDAAFWQARHDERERLALFRPPPVVRRFDDPTQWSPDAPTTSARLEGLPLTEGVVRGRAWVLQEPARTLPAGFEPHTTLLVARSVDAGWIPTLALVAGVVVETGGDLSHGSILLRERGLPAVTNVRGATSGAVTGEVWELRAGAGVAVRVSDAS